MVCVKGVCVREALSLKYSSMAMSGAFVGSSSTLASTEQICVARACNVGHSGCGDRCNSFSVASSIIVSRYVKALSWSCFGSFRRFHVSGRFVRSISLARLVFSGVEEDGSIIFAVVIVPRMCCL